MIIHLGSDIGILQKNIIAILNLELPDSSSEIVNYVNIHRNDKNTVVIGCEKPKSCVVTNRKGKSIIYLSPISAETLAKRIHQGEETKILNKGL